MKINNIILSFIVVIIMVSMILFYHARVQRPINIHNKQDVKIQILSSDNDDKYGAAERDIEVIAQSIDEDEKSFCHEDDEECKRNLAFFNNTYYSGILNQDDMNIMDIDKHDSEDDTM